MNTCRLAGCFGMWAVETLEDGAVAGLCGFFPRAPETARGRSSYANEIELRYVITAPIWEQGYATEAASAAADAALSAGYHVFATIRPSNLQSLGVAQKAGLRSDGEIADERA